MYIQGIKMELPKPKLVKNFMNVTLKSWDDLPGKVGEQNFNEIINKDESPVMSVVVWEAKPGNIHTVKDLKFEELVILLEGEHFCTDVNTGETYHLLPGDALFHGKGTSVTWKTEKGAKGISAVAPRDKIPFM